MKKAGKVLGTIILVVVIALIAIVILPYIIAPVIDNISLSRYRSRLRGH